MSNLIVLKISWKDDTRRFRVPYNIPFQRLREDVAQKFSLADFRLKYIDEENELITVASDRELHEAIEYLREVDPRKIVRFFVRTADDASTEVTQSVLGNMSMYDPSRSQFSQFGTPIGAPPPMSPHTPSQNWASGPSAPLQNYPPPQPNYGSYGSQNAPPQFGDAYQNQNAHQPNPVPPHAGGYINAHQPNTGSQGQYPVDYRRPWSNGPDAPGAPGAPGKEPEPAPAQFKAPELANNYRHEIAQQPPKPENNEPPAFPRAPIGRKGGDKQYDSRFVRDSKLPDGSEVSPGERFTKVWTVRNTGEAAWPPGTILEWQSGDKLGVDRVAVPEAEPGKDVDIEMEIVAPSKSGHYTGHYRTALPNGQHFGNRVWVDFVVTG